MLCISIQWDTIGCMKVTESSLGQAARRFATIFRREASRTASVVNAVATGASVEEPVSLAAAMLGDMKGYDLWAAAAFDLLLKNLPAKRLSALDTLHIASGLTRATMSEVAFCEARMAQGELPWNVGDAYNRVVRKSGYSHVRAFPSAHARSDVGFRTMLANEAHVAPRTRHARPGQIDPVGLMLIDKPWVLPRDVWRDPQYRDVSQVPPASFGGKEIDFDTDGLMKRVDHELLVMEAAFDDVAFTKLTEDD